MSLGIACGYAQLAYLAITSYILHRKGHNIMKMLHLEYPVTGLAEAICTILLPQLIGFPRCSLRYILICM